MSKSNKRSHSNEHHHHQHEKPSSLDKRPRYSPTLTHHHTPRQPTFVSYLDTPNLPPKIKVLCEILANTPSAAVETVLDDAAILVTQDDVERVLKLSFDYPGTSVRFFRWSGHQLNDNHSPYAWNLVVDLLGKNSQFEAMWDAVKSMKKLGLLSLATFASVFSSYVMADRVREAIMTFELMEQYGVPCDIIALNSLISAICRDGKTVDAVNFLRVVKSRIWPDADTYAILLEGWESEGNVICASETFAEMVIEIGWDPSNVPAYDSYLCTLITGSDGVREAMKLLDTMEDRRCYPGMKFLRVALEECSKKSDVRGAKMVWEAMVGRLGFRPDAQLYNAMIGLYCFNNNTDMAMKLLDEMVYHGAFPDAETYNLVFQFLIKNRKLREAASLFKEMVKNEFIPSYANCGSGVRTFLAAGEGYTAMKIWNTMIENYDSDLDEYGNLLVVGLHDLDFVQEAVKYAERMIEKGIKLKSSSLSKLKPSLAKMRKEYAYEDLLRKWKAH